MWSGARLFRWRWQGAAESNLSREQATGQQLGATARQADGNGC